MDCFWFRGQYWAACRTLIAHRRQRPPVRWRPGWNMVKHGETRFIPRGSNKSEIIRNYNIKNNDLTISDCFGDHFIPLSVVFHASFARNPSGSALHSSYTDANWTTGPPTGLVSQHEMALNGLARDGKWCKWMDGGMGNDGKWWEAGNSYIT